MARRTFVWDKARGRLVEVTGAEGRRSTMHLNQIDCYSRNPVKSPVDGRVLDSRAKLRAHNSELGVIDIGNDPAGLRPGTPDVEHGKHLRRDLERAWSALGG